MTLTGDWKLGLILSLMTATMWGFLPYSLLPLLDTLDPFTITFYRLGGGGLLLYIWLFTKNHKLQKPDIQPKTWLILCTAIIGIAGSYLFWLKGLDLTSPATTQVVVQLSPILLLIGSVILYKEPFSNKQALGVTIFIIGFLLFFNQNLSKLIAAISDYSMGVFYVVLSSISWTIYGLAQKKLLQSFHALELIAIIVTLGSLLFLPFASPTDILKLDTLQLWMLAFAMVNTTIAYGCFTAAMLHWETPRVSAVIALVPVLTLLIGYLLDILFPTYLPLESLNIISILGVIIVVTGSAVAALSKAAKKSDAPYIDYD